jgi:two-component system, OmpR family, phosphate regulon sensor histidine kinase PhoR
MAVLLVPVFLYTAFQLIQRGREEDLIRSIYERQLESLLFSVNQHCWDSVRAMESELASALDVPDSRSSLDRFFSRHPVAAGIFATGPGSGIQVAWNVQPEGASAAQRPDAAMRIREALRPAQAELDKRMERAMEGYVKPLTIAWPGDDGRPLSLLVFPSVSDRRPGFNGLIMDDNQFAAEVVGRKFAEMDEADLVFAVRRREGGGLLTQTQDAGAASFEKSEPLWVLPHLDLVTSIRGKTIAEISRVRTRVNLAFLALVNAILILGSAALVRNVTREIRLAQMKTDFVASVSHDLRTPLALIRMYAETLDLGRVRGEDRKREYYRTIVAETSRLTRLINNILDFSRMESKRKEFRPVRIALQPIAVEVATMYEFHLKQMNATLTLDVDPDVPEIDADPEMVTQALVNLVDNAVKFSPEPKWIRVALSSDASGALVSVEDRGPGIPKAEQRRIFDKFYRVGPAGSGAPHGSGLGLSLVRHVMDLHRGRVRLRSAPGEGSLFTLVFPFPAKTNGGV